MEFQDYSTWATFEDRQLERTHALYDLFSINRKRYLWEGVEHETFKKERGADENGGYTYIFKYSVQLGMEKEASDFLSAQWAVLKKLLEENHQFLERNVYKNGIWQDDYQFMVMYEFATMEGLSKTVFETPAFHQVYSDAKDQFFSNYATTIMVPA